MRLQTKNTLHDFIKTQDPFKMSTHDILQARIDSI